MKNLDETINNILENHARHLGKFNDYSSKVISTLNRKGVAGKLDLGFINDNYEAGVSARDCATAYCQRQSGLAEAQREIPEVELTESKGRKKGDLKRLNENTSFSLAMGLNFMRYEDDDVTAAIKEIFEKADYKDFQLVSIQSNADQFFNIEITQDEDDESNLELNKHLLVQKIHALRSKLFADLSTAGLPVVNPTLSAISFAGGKAHFVITILMSNTNNREWVTGKKKTLAESQKKK